MKYYILKIYLIGNYFSCGNLNIVNNIIPCLSIRGLKKLSTMFET